MADPQRPSAPGSTDPYAPKTETPTTDTDQLIAKDQGEGGPGSAVQPDYDPDTLAQAADQGEGGPG